MTLKNTKSEPAQTGRAIQWWDALILIGFLPFWITMGVITVLGDGVARFYMEWMNIEENSYEK